MGDAWLPDVVARFEPRELLRYLVVDEIEEHVAVLLVEPWPELDERGRLTFADEDERTAIEVLVPVLQERLSARDETMTLTEEDHEQFAKRPVRVGDAFAGRVDPEKLDAQTESLDFLVGPLVDITREAREAAKVQLFAAAAPVLSLDDVELLLAPEGDGGETERLA
jgi:hypothetical protein